MKFFAATAALAGLAAANSATMNATTTGEVVWTTEVVTAYTTYCPAPTTVVMNNKTHVVTEATTLTITDCPCTITKPHTGSPVTPTASGTGNKPTGPAKPTDTNPPQVAGAAAVGSFGAAALAAIAML